MFLICGTIPQTEAGLILGRANFDGRKLLIGDHEIPCTQGTAALISAACVIAECRGMPAPRVAVAGDVGEGTGSRRLYRYLIEHLPDAACDIVLLHYIMPIMGLMKKVCEAARRCVKKPVMIADSSSMYAAKAAGLAQQFDVFTPDLSEMEFLADHDAVHPAYISHHLFRSEISRVPDLVRAAVEAGSMARTVIIKGAVDHVVQNGKIIFTLNEPDLPQLEAIGGTGDTISGMVGAFIAAGLSHRDAAIEALTLNRKAGLAANATAATKIREIIAAIPQAMNRQ